MTLFARPSFVIATYIGATRSGRAIVVGLMIGGNRPRVLRIAAREADIVGFESGTDPASSTLDALRRQAEVVHEAAGARIPELHLIRTSGLRVGRGATSWTRPLYGWVSVATILIARLTC